MITNMADLVLADGQATPVNTTFSPASRVAENMARWVARTVNGGIPMGSYVCQYSVKEPKDRAPASLTRNWLKITEPELDLSVPSAPKLLETGFVEITVAFPQSWNDARKKNLLARARNLLSLGSASALGDNIVLGQTPY